MRLALHTTQKNHALNALAAATVQSKIFFGGNDDAIVNAIIDHIVSRYNINRVAPFRFISRAAPRRYLYL